MKIKLFFASILIIIGFSSFVIQDNKGLSRVDRINGTEAYFLCEPLRAYEIVLDKGTGIQAGSLLTGGLVNNGISGKAAQFVKRIQKDAEKENVKIDAVIYSSGKRVIGVKFTEDGTEATKGIGRVKKIDGLEVYVLGEPLRDYNILTTKGGGVKMKSLVTAGVANNSIETDIAKMVNKIRKSTKGGADAVVYSAGKKASGVKFK